MPDDHWHACPKCNRNLRASGVITTDGRDHPVFQCDECTQQADPFHIGQPIEIALTFAVIDGRVVDPATLD